LVLAGAGAACSSVGGGDALSDAQQVVADMELGPSDLHIIGGVVGGERAYRAGEPIVLSAEVNQLANVAVLRVSRSGETTEIFPNREHPDALVAAAAPLRIPDAGSSLNIAPDQPGVVLFEFIAASRGDSWVFHRRPEGEGKGSADFVGLGSTTRALAKDIVGSLKPGPGSSTAAAHLAVRVEAR
jgi:hypothetical protein